MPRANSYRSKMVETRKRNHSNTRHNMNNRTFTPQLGQHRTAPTFRAGRQQPTTDPVTGRTVAPPYLIRTTHPVAGGPIVRQATRKEILNRSALLTFLPVWFYMAGKWVQLTNKGIWNTTEIHCRYKLLTNSNGDTLGIGIY